MRIGVFDSGVGGLTVLKELVIKYPKHQYYYFGDNKNMPYGSKSKKELMILSDKIIQFLLDKEVDLIVIACGTISSNIYEEISKKYELPIYDIISPTVRYINNSNFNKIGVIATSMTIDSKVFEKLIKKPVFSKACPLLVPIIENQQIDKELDKVLQKYLSDLKKQEIDALILGCTHYPILYDKIKQYLPNTELINMGTVLAQELEIKGTKDRMIRLYFSKVNHTLIENIDNILPFDYQLEEVK